MDTRKEKRIKRKKSRLESKGFLVTILSFLAVALQYNNVGIPENLIDNAAAALVYGNAVKLTLIALSAVPVVLKICKRFRKNDWKWNFLKERNFITQGVVTLIMGLYFFGVISEENQIELIAAATYAINMIWHFFQENPNIQDMDSDLVES